MVAVVPVLQPATTAIELYLSHSVIALVAQMGLENAYLVGASFLAVKVVWALNRWLLGEAN